MSHTRYLNTELFEALVRPQYPSSCNITSITTAFRYLFKKDFTQEKLAQILDKNIAEGDFNPGNCTMKDWCNQIAGRLNLKIEVNIHFEHGWELKSNDNDDNWRKLKSMIDHPNSVCIIHIEGHYALILGYAWFSEKPDTMDSESGNRWLFIADPSPYHEESKIEKQHLNCSPPLWSIRWGVIREQFTLHSNYGIIQICI